MLLVVELSLKLNGDNGSFQKGRSCARRRFKIRNGMMATFSRHGKHKYD